MIFLDTNVLSELLKKDPNPQLLQWLDNTSLADTGTTAINVAELMYGAALLPERRRRSSLSEDIQQLVSDVLRNRVWGFGQGAVESYAFVRAKRKRAGHGTDPVDMYIAAICHSHRAALATRNTKDFLYTDVPLINPWER